MDCCIFCQIASDKKIVKIYEDDDVFAIFDKYQDFLGHILVIPKNHYDNILLVPEKISRKLLDIALLIGRIEKKFFKASGMNIVTNIGKTANQTIMHCHVHVIPRDLNTKNNEICCKENNNMIKNIIEKMNAFLDK